MKPSLAYAAKKAVPMLPALARAQGFGGKKRVAKRVGKIFVKNMARNLGSKFL